MKLVKGKYCHSYVTDEEIGFERTGSESHGSAMKAEIEFRVL